MIDTLIQVPPGRFLCKAITGSRLVAILKEFEDLDTVIIEPNAITGNLLVYRRLDADKMCCLGWIEISDEYFEARPDENAVYAIPEGWKR
jgi:hypothetical protein